MSDFLIDGATDKVGKWATSREFFRETSDEKPAKIITPKAAKWLCGGETNAKPEFRHNGKADGCTRRLVFIDHDNNDVERQLENCFEGFSKDIAEAKVKVGDKYMVWCERGMTGQWKWHFNPVT